MQLLELQNRSEMDAIANYFISENLGIGKENFN
jgi:hypothetical protein